ncbi:glycoside hydrolase family 16 protein [Legionella sp. PC997]|uniref:glycoside hydrolase family 16 protein n=1 Tax=Legionella sp. PC997 TaxID=2755562 RepID=UPI0015F9E669|nr:glycoside hydrolase family 16 protein [Legionella sp. PC997]QMT59661.1 hypothetical protein HBNCFIEN_01027 [Legionella sp. PC997]
MNKEIKIILGMFFLGWSNTYSKAVDIIQNQKSPILLDKKILCPNQDRKGDCDSAIPQRSVNCKQPLFFSNLTWCARDGFGSPGPNLWSSNNVWVDSKGWLHLKIIHNQGKWSCAELYTTTSLGFGEYWFYIVGQVDQLDPNVIFGLFNYPPKDTEPAGTNEIDIEFSKWGIKSTAASNSSYTVWPSIAELNKTTLSYTLKLNGNYSTHGFIWSKNRIYYQSGNGHYEDYRYPIQNWVFSPPDPTKYIPQKPLPVHINLWLNNGEPPTNGKEVELIVKEFCYKSIDGQANCKNNNQ